MLLPYLGWSAFATALTLKITALNRGKGSKVGGRAGGWKGGWEGGAAGGCAGGWLTDADAYGPCSAPGPIGCGQTRLPQRTGLPGS